MKALLSILLSILLLQSQVFALSGGPDYNKGGGAIDDVLGTYGGVLIEKTDPTDNTNGGSVAIYTVAIAKAGLSTGKLLAFDSGRVYPGVITGLGDSTGKEATFKAIIQATYSTTVTDVNATPTRTPIVIFAIPTPVPTTTTDVTSTVNGTLNTVLDPVRNGISFNILMSGTATLSISNGAVDANGDFVVDRVVEYEVSGYRQAAPLTAAA